MCTSIELSDRGVIETPMVGFLTEQHKTAANTRNALGRCGTAEEVADLIAFLLSDKSSFCSGTVSFEFEDLCLEQSTDIVQVYNIDAGGRR